jgi:hypothetical protein
MDQRFRTFLHVVQGDIPVLWAGVRWARFSALTPRMREQVEEYVSRGGSIKALLPTDAGLYTVLCTMPSMRRKQ